MASPAGFTAEKTNTPTPVCDLPLKLPRPPVNRRFSPRVARHFRVRFHDGGPPWHGIDLSFEGMMCTAPLPVWPGNEIGFELLLPGETQPLAMRGRVVELVSRGRALAMRIRFCDSDPSFRQKIAVWMARR